MRMWTPQSLYDAKPWVFVAVGGLLGVGMMVWSWAAGSWTAWRSLLCFGGVVLAIVGGATLQLRQDYRARSMWRRRTRP